MTTNDYDDVVDCVFASMPFSLFSCGRVFIQRNCFREHQVCFTRTNHEMG